MSTQVLVMGYVAEVVVTDMTSHGVMGVPGVFFKSALRFAWFTKLI
jgi:hypothetical protein